MRRRTKRDELLDRLIIYGNLLIVSLEQITQRDSSSSFHAERCLILREGFSCHQLFDASFDFLGLSQAVEQLPQPHFTRSLSRRRRGILEHQAKRAIGVDLGGLKLQHGRKITF